MPPPFRYGLSPCRIRLLVGQGSVCGRGAPDAVFPDTAEWCYPAEARKWRPGCRDEACMSLALPALVAARVTYTGTHQGEFVGIPPTGKQTTTSGVDFFRMQDGRQAEHWGGPDTFSFLVQLGVMPGPGTPGPGTPA